MIPAGLNLVTVCGAPWPACDWTDQAGRHCILYAGHPPARNMTLHVPNMSAPAPKPETTVDPLAMRA